MKIVMASDHVGFELKQQLAEYMRVKGHEVEDIGASNVARAEYPTYGRLAAEKLVKGEAERAVLICGTGFGIALAANTLQGVRCVNCTDPYTAYMSRLHNNANAIAFGGRVTGVELAKVLLDIWLTTEFEGGRHADRVNTLEEMSKFPEAGTYVSSTNEVQS